MSELKIAILEDNPEKLKKYESAVEQAGHTVVRRVTDLNLVSDFLEHFSDDPATTPDVVLVDGVLDEDAAQEELAAVRQRETFGRNTSAPTVQGNAIISEIRLHQQPGFHRKVMDSQSAPEKPAFDLFSTDASGVIGGESSVTRLPAGSVIPEDVKVIGISAAFALENADVPAASPEQVVNYLAGLGMEK